MKKTVKIRRYAILIVYLFAAVLLAGCSRVNKDNFKKIRIGMSYKQVTDILGDPDLCEDKVLSTKSCIWGSSEKGIKIDFLRERVSWRSISGI